MDMLHPIMDILHPVMDMLLSLMDMLRREIDVLRREIDVLCPEMDLLRQENDMLRPECKKQIFNNKLNHLRDSLHQILTATNIFNKLNIASPTSFITGPPEPPVDVRVKSCHGNTAEISWMHGKSNGAEILGYTVQFNLSEKPDAWYDSYEESPGDSTQAFVALAPYGTYSFRVIARNAVGFSRPSSVTSRECTTPPDRPDRNPSKVKTRTDKKGFLVIEWEVSWDISVFGAAFVVLLLFI